MTLRYDILKLSPTIGRSLTRFARRLLVKLPGTHTIIIKKKPNILHPLRMRDFELILFINAESAAETERKIAQSVYGKGHGSVSDSSTLYHPRMAFEKKDRLPAANDASALYYDFPSVSKELRDNYLQFIGIHEKFFTRRGFANITTINSSEMKISNPLFYDVYITNHFEKGYLLFNRSLKPLVTLPGGVRNMAIKPFRLS